MGITLNVFKQKLGETYHCSSNHPFTEHSLDSLLLWSSDAADSGAVYLARADQLQGRLPAGLSVICAGVPAPEIRDAAADILIVENPGDFFEFFNCVQTVYLSYLRWLSELGKASTDETDVKKLLAVARKGFPWSLILLNTQLQPMASDVSSELIPPGEGTDSPISLFLKDPELTSTEKTPEPVCFSYEELGLCGICCNIHYEDDFRGKLLAVRSITQETESADLMLFGVVRHYAERIFRFLSSSNLRSSSYMLMQRTLAAVVRHDTSLTRTDGIDALKLVGWSVNDSYRLFFFPFDGNVRLTPQASFLVTLLEDRVNGRNPDRSVSHSRGLLLDDGVVWVLNRTLTQDLHMADLCGQLRQVASQFNARFGLSSECTDFFSLHLYLQQAKSAIATGSAIDPDAVSYNFREYSLYHILNSAYAPYEPKDVIHPSLLILMDYDRQNSTEFCKTLRTFIACRYNVLKASSMLYIHRSTFTVRIKRIEEICAIDLEDERTRLHILLSYYIMESSGTRF